MGRGKTRKKKTTTAKRSKGSETATQRERRLAKARQKYAEKRATETTDAKCTRLQSRNTKRRERSLCEDPAGKRARLTVLREKRQNESPEQRFYRQQQDRTQHEQSRANETNEQTRARLDNERSQRQRARAEETDEQTRARLEYERSQRQRARAEETDEQTRARLENERSQRQRARAEETDEQTRARLEYERSQRQRARAEETDEQTRARLEYERSQRHRARAQETDEQRRTRLEEQRIRQMVLRSQYKGSIDKFKSAINVFCTEVCEICTKRCYPSQIFNKPIPLHAKSYMPQELADKVALTLCNRCRTHVLSKKTQHPSTAFWNNLNPGQIPAELKELTQVEKRLLARVIPYVKIIKYGGRFGQFGFSGKSTLFALNIFEFTEQFPNMLPRSSDNTGMIVVTEFIETIDRTREFTICRERVYAALRWLIANNPLYKDVTIDYNAVLNDQDLIRQQAPADDEQQEVPGTAYMTISAFSRIVRASWHQASLEIFSSEVAGTQCCAMAIASIVRVSTIIPHEWSTNTMNEVLIAGDRLCEQVHELSIDNKNAYPIGENNFLEVNNFDVVKDDLTMFNKSFSINYEFEPTLFGSLCDTVNNSFGIPLRAALDELFDQHSAGVLIADSKSYAVIKSEEKFYFFNSHSCGKKGKAAGNGKACMIESDNLDELHRICKRATTSKNIQYTLNHITVMCNTSVEENEHPSPSQHLDDNLSNNTYDRIPVNASVMLDVDCNQPDVEDELHISRNMNEIVRKTKDNIVNESHELKAEEFAWYFLFPKGVNGLKEPRPVKITPLDYYQHRIMGSDTRFERNDYLFYALAHAEFHKISSTISACGKKMQGQDGQVDDVYLMMRSLRGSAAYWRVALSELIGQIRCLGPPTYFLTFSCNDLNWLDMRKALLIADGRPHVDPASLDLHAAQSLIEKYPMTISRHFMKRVYALMSFLKTNENLFGRPLKDFWWRIEFQNRGSPHLHMVIWLDSYPSFDSLEGIALLDQVCCCALPPDGSEMHDLVKKTQIHRCSFTCKKYSADDQCRFAFPRAQCRETHFVEPSSNEFVRNGSRIALLKRRREEKWVNNYNPVLLDLWQGNMDIQPCGSNESIAYYIAKYISKTEPTNVDIGIAQAIQQIRREETNISRKLFKICMRILQERHVSACECAYRLCHLQMKGSSRPCFFLNTRKPDQRYKVIKFKGNQADGFCKNIFDRYTNRPDTPHNQYNWDNMCLMEFAMLFEPHYPNNSENENNDDEDGEEPADEEVRAQENIIKLKDGSKVKIRSSPAVVRVPYFTAASDPESYYYSLLLQYVPYRKEEDLIGERASAREAFQAREAQLRESSEHMQLHRQRDKAIQSAFQQINALQLLEEPMNNEEQEEIEEVHEQIMSDEQFETAKQAMNLGQRELYNKLVRSILRQMTGSIERLHWFVTGGAGTGKTYTFNLIKNLIKRSYTNNSVKVCALTGVAAKLVGGSTLHSTLKLPVQKDGAITGMAMLTGNFLKTMRQQWKEVKYLFIDEISMVPYEMLCQIDARLRQLKNCDEVFGGINVIVFGDLMQIPPVRGHQVFNQPDRFQPAHNLWHLFTLIELTQNMRQQGDNTFIDILNALRVGEMKSNMMAVLLEKVSADCTGDFAIEKALRIYPTNDQVDKHNKTVLEAFRRKGTEMFIIKAQDQLVDGTRNADNVTMETVIPSDINKTGGLPSQLEIFVGAKVMLRSNLDVSKGLVNGSIGFITEIIWPMFRRAQMYETDIPSVKIDFGRDGIHLIEPKSVQFPAMSSYGTAERRMLPLILCWACTAHKMQGSTVDQAVVYLGSRLFADGQAYVALSRLRSLEGLRIEELCCEMLTGKKPCNQRALNEMERMRHVNLNNHNI